MMKFYFISVDNLRNTGFIRDFVHHFPRNTRSLILHDHFPGTEADTRFVTKRISALLSESMIYNNPFSGDQRGIISVAPDGLKVNAPYLLQRMDEIPVVVLNALALDQSGTAQPPALQVAQLLVNHLQPEEITVFAANPKSPLVAERQWVSGINDHDRLSGLFEEEKTTLYHALSLAPAYIASPINFAK